MKRKSGHIAGLWGEPTITFGFRTVSPVQLRGKRINK